MYPASIVSLVCVFCVGGFGGEEFFAIGFACRALTWFEPIDIRAAGRNSFFAVPAGGRALLHFFAGRSRIEHEFAAALGADLIQRLGRAVNPLDIVTPFCFLGFFIPGIGRAFLHLFAKPRDDEDHRGAALGALFVQGLRLRHDPFDKVTAFVLFGFRIPAAGRAPLELFSGFGVLDRT